MLRPWQIIYGYKGDIVICRAYIFYSFKAQNVSNSKKTIKTKCRSTLTQSYLTHEEKTKANIIS